MANTVLEDSFLDSE